MRKIFSSQRVETAEGVARLLGDAGIEVRLTNGRSYRSKRSGQFSYMEPGHAQDHPSVWIVHANDQPRARELMRDARLLDTTRRDLPDVEYTFRDSVEAAGAAPRNWAWRIRIGLLLVIGAIAMGVVMRHRAGPVASTPPVPAVRTATPEPAPPPPDDDDSRVRIQPTR